MAVPSSAVAKEAPQGGPKLNKVHTAVPRHLSGLSEDSLGHSWWTQSPSSQLIYSAKPLTLLKLYPHTSIILDLLDHLSAPANNHPDRMPGHRHLREGWRRVQLGPVPAAVAPSTHHTQPMALHHRGRPALTSMPPPIRDPYSFRSPKPPWSRSRRMSITISQACCKHTGHALLQHRSPGVPPPKGPWAEAEPISAPLSSCPAVPREGGGRMASNPHFPDRKMKDQSLVLLLVSSTGRDSSA